METLSGIFQNYLATETKQDPVGLLGMEAFQTVANQAREGIQRPGIRNEGTIVQPWAGF